MIAPCKDCPDRVVGCHSTCERYKDYREEKDRELEQKRMGALGRPLMSKQKAINWQTSQRLKDVWNDR